jgi:hypothetical protein
MAHVQARADPTRISFVSRQHTYQTVDCYSLLTPLLAVVCPAGTLLFTQAILFHFVETKRGMDLKKPGSQADGSFFGITEEFMPKENGYPGATNGPCVVAGVGGVGGVWGG